MTSKCEPFRWRRRTLVRAAATMLPLALSGCGKADFELSGATRGSAGAGHSGEIPAEAADAFVDESRPVLNRPAALAADIVVIGAGGAGLAAAARAAEIGASVIVLEKMPAIGGNTLIASGYYAAVDPARQRAAGIDDSVENFFGLLLGNAGPSADTGRLMRLAVEARPVMRWLEGLGVEFAPETYEISGSLFPRTYKPVMPNGEGYIRQLSARAGQLGARILTNCRATALLSRMTAQGVPRVTGVAAQNADGKICRFEARLGVVIAAGGFSANAEMIAQYAPRYSALTHDNAPGATGEMLLAAEAIGARLVDMPIVQCQPGCPVGGRIRVRFHNDVKRFILLDGEGRRFAAEDGRRDTLRDRVLALPDSMAYVLVDDDGFRSYNRLIQREAVLAVETGDAWTSDSLEGLARQVGFDPGVLRETLARYRSGIEAGQDEYGKKLDHVQPIQRPPFWLAPAAMTVHATSGGIAVDAQGRVLDRGGRMIPGLWAAGEATGGLHGENQLGGCGLADAFVFGHACAESILGVSTYTTV